MSPPVTPPAPPPQEVYPSNSQLLYNASKACMGLKLISNDKEEFGCALAVNLIHKKAFGREIGGGASTHELWKALSNDATFKQVDTPTVGCIIISPTGTATSDVFPHGHVGIVMNYGICSNDSNTGKWAENYSFQGWETHFGEIGHFPILYYAKV